MPKTIGCEPSRCWQQAVELAAAYAEAMARFGERGVIDLIAVAGYYDIVCMTLNVAQVPVPPGSTAPPLAALR